VTEQYDFSGPYMAVAIRNREGKVFPLWSKPAEGAGLAASVSSAAGAIGGASGDAELPPMPWVSQVTVTMQLADVPVITVLLTPPFREGLQFLDSPLIEFGDSELQVQLGYVGGTQSGYALSPVFSGLLLEPSVAIGEDIQITLNAHGTGGFSAARQEGSRTAKEGETRLELIERIAAGPNGGRNLKVNVDDIEGLTASGDQGGGLDLGVDAVAAALGSTGADLSSETAKLMNEPVVYSQGGKSDWQALWELVNAAQAWMLLENEADEPGKESKPVLKIYARDKRLGRPPSRILRLFDYDRGQIGQDSSLPVDIGLGAAPAKDYPILGMSNPPASLYLPDTVRHHLMEEISDADPQEENKKVLNGDEVKRATTAKGTAGHEESASNPDADPDKGDGGTRIPGDPKDTEALQNAIHDFKRVGNQGIELDVETVGIPDLKPGETVLLKGVGLRFGNHRWGVHEITHTIGGDGFTTSMKIISNTEAIATFASKKEEGAQANTTEPEGASTKVPF
jgi:hypothetical protein